MLKIQVLGSGMIPRGLGIAPRKEPFFADKNLIYTILQTEGLKVNYQDPNTGRMFPLTRDNLKRILEKYKDATYDRTTVNPPMKPHAPEPPKNEVKQPSTPATPPTPPAPVVPPQPKVEEKKPEEKPAEEKTEPKKEETKIEDKKSEEKKPEVKKDEKPQGNGLKPVVGQGQNTQNDKK